MLPSQCARAAASADGPSGWLAAGSSLRQIGHVWIISLARSAARRRHVTALMGRLGLQHGSDFSFTQAADCLEYDRLGEKMDVLRATAPSKVAAWEWLRDETCTASSDHNNFQYWATANGSAAISAVLPPSCLSTELAHCRKRLTGSAAARHCKEVCYSLSVASALHGFLASNRSERMLLLEDDACATPALLDSPQVFARLAQPGWSVVKLGHCLLRELSHDETSLAKVRDEDCVGYPAAAAPPRLNELRGGLGYSYCSHALGVDRAGAQALLRLALPVSAVFDDMLLALAGGFGKATQVAALARAGLADEVSTARLMHARYSLFGQVEEGELDRR